MTWAPHSGDEVGAGARIDRESVVASLGLAREGRIFDLDIGRFAGMPRHPLQPPFDLSTYRTPRGARAGANRAGPDPDNLTNFGFSLELVSTSMHLGTHIDALCHVTAGDDDHWYGGFTERGHLGDKGALASDVTHIPPIVTRGVLLDVAGAHAKRQLPPGYAIGPDDLELALLRAGTELRPGDVVLVHTGQLRDWPSVRGGGEPGLGIEGARWLSGRGPVAVGADNAAVEVLPSVVPGDPQPVHVHLMVECGIYIMEWMYLDELADAGISEFLFVCLPLKIDGATGSLVRPVAIT